MLKGRNYYSSFETLDIVHNYKLSRLRAEKFVLMFDRLWEVNKSVIGLYKWIKPVIESIGGLSW